jgi:hypothetical protein
MVEEGFWDSCEFDKLMLRIDHQLADKNLKIFQRPFHAWTQICKEFGIYESIGGSHNWQSARKTPSVYDRVSTWYKSRYGDRLKVYTGYGRMAFLIDNDVWIFRLPRISGTVYFFASRIPSINKTCISRKGVSNNILDCIEKLPNGLRNSLSDSFLNQLLQIFLMGFDALHGLESLIRKDDLTRLAMADIETSVDHLLARSPEYGLSKWASLQAAEKVIKAAMRINSAKYSRTHNLIELVNESQKQGIMLNVGDKVSKIQCSAGIRYGEEVCTLRDAVDAHHAVLELSNHTIRVIREAIKGK